MTTGLNMKKIVFMLGVASALTLLAACSDEKSEIAEVKTTFVAACVSSSSSPTGLSKETANEICGCTYDKAIEKYGIKEFKRIDENINKSKTASAEFEQSLIQFVQECAQPIR